MQTCMIKYCWLASAGAPGRRCGARRSTVQQNAPPPLPLQSDYRSAGGTSERLHDCGVGPNIQRVSELWLEQCMETPIGQGAASLGYAMPNAEHDPPRLGQLYIPMTGAVAGKWVPGAVPFRSRAVKLPFRQSEATSRWQQMVAMPSHAAARETGGKLQK